MKEINLQEYFDLGLGTKAQLCNWKEKNRQKLLNPKVKLSMKNRAEKNGYSLLIDDQRSLNSGRKKSQVRQDIETLTFYMLVNRMVSGKQGEYLSMSKWVPELLFTEKNISPYIYEPNHSVLKKYNISMDEALRIQEQLFGYIKNHLRATFSDLNSKQILLSSEKMSVLTKSKEEATEFNKEEENYKNSFDFVEINPISTREMWDEIGNLFNRHKCKKHIYQIKRNERVIESIVTNTIINNLDALDFEILQTERDYFLEDATISNKYKLLYDYYGDRFVQEQTGFITQGFLNSKKDALTQFFIETNFNPLIELTCFKETLKIISKYSGIATDNIANFWSTYSYTLKTGSARLETYFLKQRKTLSHKRAQEEFIKYYSEYKKLIKKLDIEYSKYLILDNIERISKKADIDLI